MSFQPLRFCLWDSVSLVIALLLVVSASAQDRPIVDIVANIPHVNSVTAVAFSRDWALALSGSEHKTLKLWDAATGQLLHTFAGHAESVNSNRVLAQGHPRALGGTGRAQIMGYAWSQTVWRAPPCAASRMCDSDVICR